MTKVPLSVISGKSPMNTVWLLISPVSLFMNSAVTNSGAAYVTSRSLHSSTEFFAGSKRGSAKERDMVPEKSSMGEISSKISSRPDLVDTAPRPETRSASALDFQVSLPINQSKLSVCSASSSGTSRGSAIFAKEMRRGVVVAVAALREAAKRRPSESSDSTHVRMPTDPCQGQERREGSANKQSSLSGALLPSACPDAHRRG